MIEIVGCNLPELGFRVMTIDSLITPTFSVLKLKNVRASWFGYDNGFHLNYFLYGVVEFSLDVIRFTSSAISSGVMRVRHGNPPI